MKELFGIENVRGDGEAVKKIATTKGISLTFEEEKVIQGWLGAPKGQKQIAYERGFINLKNLHLYTKDGHRDNNSNIIDDDYSIKKILAECYDFINEKTSLQRNGAEIGQKLGMEITIDRTPKCHPEVAGIGIEYTWAQCKIYMRNISWKLKKKKKDFHNYVRLSIARDEGAMLTTKRIRKFVARARDYIAAYCIISNGNNKVLTRITKRDIDKMRKAYRTHRSIERMETARAAAEQQSSSLSAAEKII